MKVDIRSRKIAIDEALRAHVDSRLRFALGRFGERIAKVTVRFDDFNDPFGGVEKQCLIDVALRPSGSVLVVDTDVDLRTVFDRLADRAARDVDRDLQRRKDVG
jgi:putative sigma-54 modulation protein